MQPGLTMDYTTGFRAPNCSRDRFAILSEHEPDLTADRQSSSFQVPSRRALRSFDPRKRLRVPRWLGSGNGLQHLTIGRVGATLPHQIDVPERGLSPLPAGLPVNGNEEPYRMLGGFGIRGTPEDTGK